MGLFNRTPAEVISKRESIIASAAHVNLKGTTNARVSSENWHRQVWHFFDCIGEYRAVCQWVGNLLSRATLYITKDEGNGAGPQKVTDAAVNEWLDALFDGRTGQSQMLGRIGLFYAVEGQAYIIGYEEDGRDHWIVATGQSLKQGANGSYQYDEKELPANAFVLRIWDPHPVSPKKSNSPSRAALPVLAQMERLTQRETAQLDSALSNAGITFLPDSMTFSGGKKGAEAFMEQFLDTVSAGLEDPGSAASLVPTFVTADKEDIAAVRHVTFSVPLDKESSAKMKDLQHRLALSLDVPPEIMSGVGDTNHWSGWLIDESSIKSHTEPLLDKICADLTDGYLHTLIRKMPGHEEDFMQYAIKADTSEMRLRPNRSKEALELFDRLELSGEAALRETGFRKEDAMGDEERALRLLLNAAKGSTTPEIVAQALNAMGVPIVLNPQIIEDSRGTQEERPTPSLTEHPTRDIPENEQAAILAAAEQMVWRALERAGNRLKTKLGTSTADKTVDACDLYRLHTGIDGALATELLTDAWSKVPKFASRLSVDPKRLVAALDAYTRSILTEGKKFDIDKLELYLVQFIFEEDA